jgi:hypothetical protein
MAEGTKAIEACKPTNSVADASVMLTELYRDGIPKITGALMNEWRKGTKKAHYAASEEYLNSEFGWKPLKNDIQNFMAAVVNANRAIAQYERDSGKIVRRRYDFEPEITRSSSVSTGRSPYIELSSSTLYDTTKINQGAVLYTRETVRRKWFSGAFTYYVPSGYDSRNAMERQALKAAKVYGLELTPEVVWNILPWSWAADWVSNLGSVVSNFSDWATDGLVMRHGYMMEHCSTIDTYTFLGPTGFQSGGIVSPVSLITETKNRVPASPFGFGIPWENFSPRQNAILLALGITRGKQKTVKHA